MFDASNVFKVQDIFYEYMCMFTFIIFISFMKNVNNYYNYVHKFQLSFNKVLEVKPRSHRSSALTLWIGPEPI